MLIGSRAGQRAQLEVEPSARLMSTLGVALADAFLSCSQAKYHYNLLRPDAYIVEHIDAEWSPFVATPVFPEYTSGHSVASAAAAVMLADQLGQRSFVDDTHDVTGYHERRSFSSFRAAAEQAATSRLFGGIHYPMGIEAGLVQGERVGERVLTVLSGR